MATQLPANHHRSISTTAQIVEKVLNEMEEVLQNRKHNVTTVVTESFTQEQKQELLLKIEELKKSNRTLFQEFNLTQTEHSELQIVRAQTAYLWTVLMDSKSKKLKGFGKIPADTAEKLDEHINAMLAILEELNAQTE